MDRRDHRLLRLWLTSATGAAVLLFSLVWVIISLRAASHNPMDAGDEVSVRLTIEAVGEGDTGAATTLRRLARTRWDELDPHVDAMFTHRSPLVRATACEVAGGRSEPDRLPALVLRASDSDWRVRAAAFEALDRRARLPGRRPLRDTPLAQRETVLLDWLDAYDTSAEQPIGPNLCNVYAQRDHVEVGAPLVGRCLQCHRPGPSARPSMECGECHQRVYDQWSSSAHAQTLSHLRLTTVNPETRQPEPMTFEGAQGLVCTTCHQPAESDKRRPQQESQTTDRCRFTFAARAGGPYTKRFLPGVSVVTRLCRVSQPCPPSWTALPRPGRRASPAFGGSRRLTINLPGSSSFAQQST